METIVKTIVRTIKIGFLIVFILIGMVFFFGGFSIMVTGCKTQFENTLPPEGSFLNPDKETIDKNGEGKWEAIKGLGLIVLGAIIIPCTLGIAKEMDKKEKRSRKVE